MADIKVEHLAQLMLGVARSQLAVLDSIESLKAGFKTGHARSIIESASRIRSNHPETLVDFPSRLLLQMLGRNPPDAERLTRELNQLLSGKSTTPSKEELAAETAPKDANSLDMT
jgi:hypothetical protein